jgi:hypothetical protein
MKSFLILVTPVCILSIGCSNGGKQTQDFNPNPIKKAFVENAVVAYVSFEIDSGRISKIDSAILDSKGNVVKIKNIGCCYSEWEMKYDSLDRLISTSQKSDITNFVKLKYELPTKSRLVCTEYLSDFEGDSGEMVFQTITEFDLKLNKPITRKEIHLTSPDTTNYFLKYNNGLLVKEILLPEKDSAYTKYEYSNNRLIQKRSVKTVDLYHMYNVDFFSEDTGLLDSTHSFDGEFLFRTYYKYYFRDQ